jgi:serpin B
MNNENEKENRLLEAIGGIDENFIKNAAPGPGSGSKKINYIRLVAIAAAFVILVIAGALLIPGLFKNSASTEKPDNNRPDTPTVTGTGVAQNSPAPTQSGGDNRQEKEPDTDDKDRPVTSRGSVDLMEGIAVSSAAAAVPSAEMLNRAADFAFKLFKACYNGENMLISPLSVAAALGMATNGAEGDTLSGMEETLGMSRKMINDYIDHVTQKIAKDGVLTLANSIWFRDKLSDGSLFNVREDFLNKNALFYRASLYKAPFDAGTVKDINDWVNKNTHEMIPTLLDQIPDNTLMYLINALVFEGAWRAPFDPNSTARSTFTEEDGTQGSAEYMHSEEDLLYIKCANAKGFAKYYEGDKYAYVALLPNEGTTVSELVNSLDGHSFRSMLSDAYEWPVELFLPKYKTEYSLDMNKVLSDLGMGIAFTDSADFSGISDLNLAIGSVAHKTFMSVDEKGTVAAAITGVSLYCNADHLLIRLDRPFIYMLVDMTTGVPFFTGAMMSME